VKFYSSKTKEFAYVLFFDEYYFFIVDICNFFTPLVDASNSKETNFNCMLMYRFIMTGINKIAEREQ
jgi:hypothetical protein